MAGQRGREIGVGAQQAAGFSAGNGGAQLHRHLGLAQAAGHITGAQAQPVRAGLVARGVQPGQHALQGGIALGHQREFIAAEAGDLQPPEVEVAVDHAAAQSRAGAQHAAGQQHIKSHYRRRRVQRITHLQRLGDGGGVAVHIGGAGHQLVQAAGGGHKHHPAARIQRHRCAIERQAA